MRIVINAAFLPGMYAVEYMNFLFETFKRITQKHLQHQFIFICERESAGIFAFGKNVEVHRIKTRKVNVILWKYWYDVRIPYLLRKYKADLFFSPGGICSFNTKVPQCMIINDLFFLRFPSFFTKTRLFFYKNYTRKSIHKAKKIITLSGFTKEDVIRNYSAAADKIDTIYNGITEEYGPQPDATKEETKIKYTDRKEYFLYTGLIHPSGNLINLLKAFSLFKKRQQSNLKLIICGKGMNDYKSFGQLLQSYKYKNDVSFFNDPGTSEISKLISSAYALVYPVLADDFSTPPIAAMQSHIPVITSVNSAMQEITNGAALYVNPENPRDIADAMMRLYKDEKLRNELIEKGKTAGLRYDMDKTAKQLWDTIQTVLL